LFPKFIMVSGVVKSSPSSSSSKDFPTKVLVMLEMDQPVFSWLPHGRAIKVHDEQRFLREIAPLFFKVSKFRSFTRQLHLWGFRRISSGVDADGWWHQYFLRGRPDLICQMIRTKVKGNGKGKRDVVKAPNFYDMPSPNSEREGTYATADRPPSLPDTHPIKKYESTTPFNQAQSEFDAELDDYFRGQSGVINDHRDISPYPFAPRFSNEHFINTWQTEAHAPDINDSNFVTPNISGLLDTQYVANEPNCLHAPAFNGSTFVAPHIGDLRETQYVGNELNFLHEPLALPPASTNMFRSIQEEDEDEFRAFIGRQIQFP